jgi:hypothetical protein
MTHKSTHRKSTVQIVIGLYIHTCSLNNTRLSHKSTCPCIAVHYTCSTNLSLPLNCDQLDEANYSCRKNVVDKNLYHTSVDLKYWKVKRSGNFSFSSFDDPHLCQWMLKWRMNGGYFVVVPGLFYLVEWLFLTTIHPCVDFSHNHHIRCSFSLSFKITVLSTYNRHANLGTDRLFMEEKQ